MLGTRAKISVVVGLAFAALFLMLGIRELQRPSPAAAMTVPVAATPRPIATLALAARAIATGETITADLVRNGTGEPGLNPLTAAPAEAVGKVAIRPIAAGTPILRSAIGTEDKLAIRVPVGMRAMSIDTTAEIAVAGLVRPGDRVDVQVVYPGADAINGARGEGRSRATTLLQMVQVLAVGETVVGAPAADNGATTGGIAPPPPQARTVTLALTPAQVSTLSLAKNVGALFLSLRNPTDIDVAAAAPAAADPAPVRAAAGPTRRPARRAAAPAAPQAIELVVGDRRELIYSGSGAAQ
jgi:pilus assembly protein CpaB